MISQRAALMELARRRQISAALPTLFNPAFPQQRRVVEDAAYLKAIFCTRRSAKSFTLGLYMVHEALANPGCNCLFIGLTRASAKAIIWKDILRVIDYRYRLGARFNEADLTMTFPNGSVIYITGVDTHESEMLKLLGRKYRLVAIDEASMYTIDVRNLVYGVLGPAMVDPSAGGQRGTICLAGTASNFPRGLFFDITTGAEPGWSLHEWGAHDNPYVATQWAEALEEIRLKRPLYMQTPQFRQWYKNEWVVDDEKLCYRFSPKLNLVKELPKLAASGWAYVLGIDLGWEDDSAFVLTQYHEHDPNLYVSRVFKRPKLTFAQVEEIAAKMMRDRLTGELLPCRVFIDGANKQGVESMRQRSNLPFEPTDKRDKISFIELANSDLIQAKIKVVDRPENRALWDEMMALVWLTDGDKIVIPKKEHPALPNHTCDAFLYAWRMGYHYQATKAKVTAAKGSKAWYEEQATDIWERERERLTAVGQQGLWPEEPLTWPSEPGWGA